MEIRAFETPARHVVFHYGVDWGFSQDPTALVRCFEGGDGCLYVDYEAYGFKVDFPDLPALFDQVPGVRDHTLYADNARPETISYMRKTHGFHIEGCEKGRNSIEEGIAYLRSYRAIVIHPRCTHLAREFQLYTYATDPKDPHIILPRPIDAHNHGIDALRYALSAHIKSRGFQPYSDEELFEIETGL